jgi:hypothetical protein
VTVNSKATNCLAFEYAHLAGPARQGIAVRRPHQQHEPLGAARERVLRRCALCERAQLRLERPPVLLAILARHLCVFTSRASPAVESPQQYALAA